MGNCFSCFRGDGEARALKATGAASAQQNDGAPHPSYTPSSVADHRAYQSAPLLRPRSLHPSEVVPVNPSPFPAPPPQAEELSRATAASSGDSRSPYDHEVPFESTQESRGRYDDSSTSAAAAAAYYDPSQSAAYYNSSFNPQAYREPDSSSFPAAPPAQQPPPPAAPLLPVSSSAESSLPAQVSAMGSARDSAASARTSAGLPPLREFTYAELRAATGGFSDLLGEGGFGQVYRGRLMLPQAAGGGAMGERDVAVKVTNGRQFTERDMRCFEAEVAAMSALNHPNILRLEGVAMDMEQRPILVYEFIPGGDVRNLLRRVRGNEARFSWKKRVKVALGCAEALAAIHQNRFIHRDFKSSNVLLREDFTPVLADFGLARTIEDWRTHVSTAVVGTFGYIDPNYWQTGQLNQQADTYAFGVFLLELIFGYPPLDPRYQELQKTVSPRGFSNASLVTDPTIKDEWSPQHVLQMVVLARFATNPSLRARIDMDRIVTELANIWSAISAGRCS
ncbi:unnamed protein product [Closterium sp. NIES-54]